MTLARKLEEFLGGFYAEIKRSKQDASYQSIFSDEGFRKSQYVIDDLDAKVAQHGLELSEFALISIGGSDGSELEALLRASRINSGFLLEMSSAACARARGRAADLAKNGKRLEVIEGDAVDRIGDAFARVRDLGLSGIVVSAQAILHELPWRSSSYIDSNRFLGRLFSEFPKTIFYAREPCKPREWPPEVEFHVPGIRGERLHQLITMVSRHFGQDDSRFQVQPDDYVICESGIAVEVLHKLLRCQTVAQFRYEMGERLTALNAEDVRQFLIVFCGGASNVQAQWLSTAGFRESYAATNVVARNPLFHKAFLPVPDTHVLFKAIRLPANTETRAPPSRAPGSARSSKPKSKRDIEQTSPRAALAHSVGGSSSIDPARAARVSSQNLISTSAELSISSTQGSLPSLFDLAPEVRFGRTVLEVDGIEVEYGLTEAIIELSASDCAPLGERLGDSVAHPFIAAEAGNKWRITGPRDNNGTLSRSPISGQALCQMASEPTATGQRATLDMYCHKYHIKYAVMTNNDENAVSPTTEAILGVFLNLCLRHEGQALKLSRAEIEWGTDAHT
jgi:hypothetical protein